MVCWQPLSNDDPFVYISRSMPCCKLYWYSRQLFDQFPLRLTIINILGLYFCFTFKLSEICFFRTVLRGAKLFWDTVTKSLGLLHLPRSRRHLTTFSAVLYLVTAETPWQTEQCYCKWWITSSFGRYTGLDLHEFGQQLSVKWWKLKGSQIYTQVATKPSTPTLFSDVYRVINTQHCNQTSTNQIYISLTFNGKPNCQRWNFAERVAWRRTVTGLVATRPCYTLLRYTQGFLLWS